VTDADRAAGAAAELVEVVDESGRVLEVVRRDRMRAERLRHRCTYIAVVDRAGRAVVHQRAPWKDVWPGHWDVAFGGVVGVGEDWAPAAERELAEEAGITAPLTEVAQACFDDDRVSVLGRVYVAEHDGPFTVPDGEVVALDRVPLADLDAWARGRPLCADSLALVVPALRAWADR
jgi:8-oxo-dGTP pyrophosphatase MutT (NUDIX family)